MLRTNHLLIPAQSQRGSALIVSLIILMVLTLLGVAGMQNTTLEEKMAGNTRDVNLAFNSAESALREGEFILGNAASAAVLPAFVNGATDSGGYYLPDTVRWDADLTWDSKALVSGTTIPGVASQPLLYIEEMPASTGGASLQGGVELTGGSMYRVTARGVGSTSNAIVILRSTYRR